MITGTLLATLLCVAQPQTPPDTAKLDRFFDRLAEKSKAMGSLTVVKDGKVLYARAIGYGRIDGTEKDPLTAASRFRIGSITKMFTAAMVLQLVEGGELKLTDTLDQFYPQVPNARTITVAHLLAHRSGVPNVRRDGQNVNTLPMGHDERLALIAKGKPDFAPGTQFRYSNSGYHLLGLILEKVTGKPYGEALRDRITAKVGLTDTYLATGAIDVTKNEALTYIRIGTDWKPVPETHPSILFSGGGVVSTPGDLAKFARALFDGKVVTKESLDRMRTIRDGDEMGMGMEKYTFAGKTFYGHAGGGDNYGAWLAYLPEEKLAVAYATNAKVYPVPDLVRGVVDIYSGKPFTIPTLESLAVRPEVLDQYVGVYANPDATAKATITRDGATLFFKPPGTDSAVPLEATAENKFQIEGVAVIEFEKGRMTVKRRGGERVFTKENVPRSALDLLDIDGRHPLVPLPDAVVALPHDRWRVVLQGAECRRHGRPRGGVPPAAGVARVHGLVPASACSPNQVLHLTRPASALPGLHSLPVRAGQVTTVAAIRWCCSTARS